MTDIIIVGILVIAIILGIAPTIKHFKGKGGCCGGGDIPKKKKKLTGTKMGEKEILIEGMHCDNCKNNVERSINKIEGAVCKVNLKKKRAIVSYSKEIEDEVLIEAIECLGFEVKGISNIN